MKKISLWMIISILLVFSTVFSACTQTTSTTDVNSTQQSLTTTSSTQTLSSTISTSTQSNWWDTFGEPQYGGTITVAVTQTGSEGKWDPLMPGGGGYFYDPIFYPDWTLDRNIWEFKGPFVPDQYIKGNLAETWEITDPQTVTVNIWKGIKWQNKQPVNGREFTAFDIQAHYQRAMGGASPFSSMLSDWESVTATDSYTVVFKFKITSCQWLQSIASNPMVDIESPEWAALSDADKNNWENTVGTGPWMLTDCVQNSSCTYSKNPDYFGHDERYPENQLPYADKLVAVVISDSSTRIAGFRTGKVDYLGFVNTAVTWQQAEALSKTNPDVNQAEIPNSSFGVAMRLDAKPFTDINVRKALNMAIDRPSIANSYYGGHAVGNPSGMILTDYKGYCYTYDDWPQTLKDEYTYNTAKAKQLLKDAGYPDGFQTNVVASNSQDMQVLQLMKAEFQDIGVDMSINVMDAATYENMRRDSKDDQMITEYGSYSWALTRVVEQFYSKGSDAAETMVNDSTYDSLHDKFYATTDSTEAQQIAMEMDKYVIEQHWLVTVGESYAYVTWQPYLKGCSGEYFYSDGWIAFARMWIDPSLKK